MEEEKMRGVASFGDFSLPTDLALDILVRIPLGRQLFCLRLVCPSWNDLLRSPRFLQFWSQRYRRSCCFVMVPPPSSYPPARMDVPWRPLLPSLLQDPLKTHLAAYFIEDFRISNCGYWFELPLQWFNRGQSYDVEDPDDYCVRALAGSGSAGIVLDILYPPDKCPSKPLPFPIIRTLDFLAGTYRLEMIIVKGGSGRCNEDKTTQALTCTFTIENTINLLVPGVRDSRVAVLMSVAIHQHHPDLLMCGFAIDERKLGRRSA
ncbi:hypothetical protein GOP47_0018261 [Adiantum capillus-veneris]|uniref:F-box domain-containing protein n=1 Tax=Adiantum capillus-veneris TaxID=13818 RepID=A0A9D4Z9Y9_ADICA|nr:hypothetical protein GOP47_0018261 [Adiantum capillus-veneris]